MNSLIVSLSGVRGTVGKSLTPDVLLKLSASFGTILGSGARVLLCTDTRNSRDMCSMAVISGLISAGCDVVCLGICPTPTLQVMLRKLRAEGGISITASHNPPEWNGLKFYNHEGILLSDEEMKRLFKIFNGSKITYVSSSHLGRIRQEKRAFPIHRLTVLRAVDSKLIEKRKFKVVLDCGNGAGSVIVPELLKDLGCKVIKLNCELKASFGRNTEPVPENIKGLCREVRKENAAVGFALDPDADRLAIVTEEGKCLGEDFTLTLATELILSRSPGPVVTTVSTTHAVEKVAEKFGCPVIRTKVGERNVVGMMKKKKAVLGGEGNGGVILPEVCYGRDSLSGIAIILQYMAGRNKKISELASSIPSYYILKGKIPLKKVNPDRAFKKLRSAFKSSKLDLTDGIKVVWDDSWVHLRVSGTEPAMRLISEAKTKEKAQKIFSEVEKLLKA